MIISNIHNRTPKSGILFTDMCIGDFFNRHDFMIINLKSCFTTIICEQKFNQSVDTSDCEQSEARAPNASSRGAEKLLSQFTLGPYELCVM